MRRSWWALRAGGCALFGGGRLRGGPCAGGEFGQARGDGGDDLADAKHTRRPWIAGFLGGRASVGLIAKLALVMEADVSFAVLRPGFVSASTSAVAAVESVHTPWPAQLRVNAGVELRF